VTRIGSNNLFMAYSHIAHDCNVGSHAVFANGATLAGHVTIEDYANVGAFSPVHQFCRVGRYAYIGACTVITQDVPPFSRVVTERETHCYGVNTVGLERHGFDRERLDTIESAFRLLLRSKLNTSQALEQIRAQLNGSPDVRELVNLSSRPSAACTSEFARAHVSPTVPDVSVRWGLIAGNGQFPFWCSKRRAVRELTCRDRDSRRGLPRSRKNRVEIALGQPRRVVTHARTIT